MRCLDNPNSSTGREGTSPRASARRGRDCRSAGLAMDVGKALLLGLAYYVAASLSLRMALVGGQVTPIWPPTGIALVGLLLFGRKFWPGIALGAFLVNAPIGPSLFSAGAIAVGNTLAPLIAATVLQKMASGRSSTGSVTRRPSCSWAL